jgi:hypothetical protein
MKLGTEIELQYARLLPFGEINRFISAITNFTASGNAEEAQRVKNTIHETMLNELWQHDDALTPPRYGPRVLSYKQHTSSPGIRTRSI